MSNTTEGKRLNEHYNKSINSKNKTKKWLKWGPYLSERQWGTVREDYSATGEAWDYFPHDHARSRTYRWGEDGIAGISDDRCRIAFSVALWNGKDPILKERLYGHTGPEGNHGEDCKELYYYLDSTPTHSYMKHLYKYPQNAFPYEDLAHTNQLRDKNSLEYELLDTGIFSDNQYFDVFTEYAKSSEEDICIKITVYNRYEEDREIFVLPTLLIRNLWSFGIDEGHHSITKETDQTQYGSVILKHGLLKDYQLQFQKPDRWLFTNNETNFQKVFGGENESPYVKDLFHDVVLNNNYNITEGVTQGTKFSPLYKRKVKGNGSIEIRLRLSKKHHSSNALGKDFERVFEKRIKEADEFYAQFIKGPCEDTANIQRQAFAGLLWTKQYYNIDMEYWMRGDPGQPAPPEQRKHGRNKNWMTLNNEDIISMPDKWEYPWYAAWDLAFHCVTLGMVDTQFAKDQMILMLREWYMAPNGQIPAYEWAFSDVNPPVQAWAIWQIYDQEKKRTGKGDVDFLKRTFTKLALNFTWWVNRKDHNENNVFEGGFLGLDNIGVFDRSNGIPGGGFLEQADGTAWMAMFALNMLEIAVEIAQYDPTYEDMCTKYFEHFVYISESLNNIGDRTGCWDEEEGFFYDVLVLPDGRHIPLKVRSLVGLMTLNAVLSLDQDKLKKLPYFKGGIKWFRKYRGKLGKYKVIENVNAQEDILLSLVPEQRMRRLLEALLNEQEFLSDFGIRSMSKVHEHPYYVNINDQYFGVRYTPAESDTYLFGGNSNWRGPIWIPMNYLFILTLRKFHEYYGDHFKIAYPTGSENELTLLELSDELSRRLLRIFKKDENGDRPVNALHKHWYRDEHFKDLVLFFEYFHGDNGRGVGASHQTGWTACIASLIEQSCY